MIATFPREYPAARLDTASDGSTVRRPIRVVGWEFEAADCGCVFIWYIDPYGRLLCAPNTEIVFEETPG